MIVLIGVCALSAFGWPVPGQAINSPFLPLRRISQSGRQPIWDALSEGSFLGTFLPFPTRVHLNTVGSLGASQAWAKFDPFRKWAY
jgi:hypothetical protein